MENRLVSIVVRTLLILILLTMVGAAAFAGGFGLATLIGRQATPVPPPSPTTASGQTQVQPPPPSPPPTTDEQTFQLFWEVWNIVQREYYGELPDMQTVTYGAIQGMLETLDDPYTSFIEPSIAAIINEDASGSFEGIGAYVRMGEDGRLELVSIFEGSPAEAAGLRAGDRVVAVDGQSIVGYGIYEAIGLIRGPAGTPVTLTIERGSETPFDVTVVRARLTIPLVESEMLDGNVAYIRLTEFSATATEQMEAALDELMAQRPVGIVLDLRNNPGGWLDQAVEVADLFLGNGVVLIERFSDGTENVFRSYDGEVTEDIPLVVLVNGGTASASEIVAGAIQDRGRGILIGEQTFGKGSVQRPYTLSDGSELRVTIARWFTPNDVAIHGQGLTPDIVVPIPEDTPAGQDPQLERAVQYLLTGE